MSVAYLAHAQRNRAASLDTHSMPTVGNLSVLLPEMPQSHLYLDMALISKRFWSHEKRLETEATVLQCMPSRCPGDGWCL